jgi:two-component system, NarL family, sensor histidine kinase DesK
MQYAVRCSYTGGLGPASLWSWAATLFGLALVAVPTVAFAISDPSAWQVALVVALMPVFAYSFLAATVMQRPLLIPLATMVVVAVTLTLAARSDFGLLFIHAAAAAGVRLEGPANALAVAAITALAAATVALTNPEAASFWGFTSAVFGTGFLWLLIGGLLRSNAALREARAELADLAVAEERLRFARDLHDVLGHNLSLIALKAELAGKLVPDSTERAAVEIDDIKELARGGLAQVRQAVSGYRRPTLPGELAGARMALEAAGIELRVDAAALELGPEAESVLAWAVREGATNVVRHSGARHAEITIRPGATAELAIVDDGRAAPGGNPGFGLAGLRERARSIGGTLEAGPEPEGGFRLRVCVPADGGDPET